MECPRVCVIDSSPTILETIPIVLGGAYWVECLTPDAYLRDPSQLGEADLLIVADDALPLDSLVSLTHGPPILWLQSRRGPPPVTTGQWAQIPRSFSPEDLRARIQALLSAKPGTTPWSPWSVIDYPLIPKDATLLAHRASTSQLPIMICGEPGTGKTRVARGIHSLGRGGRFVSLSAAHCNWATLRQAGSVEPGHLTMFVNDLSALTDEGRDLLLEVLDCGGFLSVAGWHSVRLICATKRSIEGIAASPRLDRDLFYRLSVLPINLPALRERPHDIPALAAYVTMELERRLPAEPVTFTERAIHRLMHYLWFGNLAEFETVLARTLALTPSRSLDADDLLFGYGPIAARAGTRPPASREAPPQPMATAAAELIINELSHEFKNPMVTIKTVAQHLERLLADETGREQVARLTGEAVERMDRTLDNLLQFTRFRTPGAEEVSISALLASPLADLARTFAERRVLLKYQPTEGHRVFVDAAQIVYAFGNMLRAIARDLVEGQTLSIRPLGSTTAVVFEFATPVHPISAQLAELVNGRGEPPAMPLGMIFAKALIERNKGRVDIRATAERTTITVRLPSRAEIAP